MGSKDFDLSFLSVDFEADKVNKEKLKEVKSANETNAGKLKALPENLGEVIYDCSNSGEMDVFEEKEQIALVRPQTIVAEFNFEADQLQQEYSFLRAEILKLVDKSNVILDKVLEYSEDAGMLKGGLVLAFAQVHAAISADIKLLSQLPQRYQQIKKTAVTAVPQQQVPVNNGVVNNNIIYVSGSSQNVLDNLDDLINKMEKN